MPYLFQASCELTKEEIFVMTLRKLRRNTPFIDLADDYAICVNTASKYFHRTVKVMHDCLQYVLEPPPKEIIIRHTPQAFKRYYGNRRVLVMDCFEVRTERPGIPKAANAHHSAYKMSSTTKFLIVMAADGSVAFVSNAYVGRCSDRFITVSSGFLELIEPDDVILADKGFDIADLIESRGATLNIPTFLRKNVQMNPLNIERDRQITSLRVHVERMIGRIKEKYTFLNGTIQVNSLRRSENNGNTVDLITRLACILLSFNKSIVSD
ncbi:uncharacterized protein LOC135701394 [Ochlerotatus camptorhynchus]|uniref:uncharacterized protein LOC135701394 n=1 Tax=Ochlerotatus camptorhynchus TaxID=644619 RepID=UPI0031D5B829